MSTQSNVVSIRKIYQADLREGFEQLERIRALRAALKDAEQAFEETQAHVLELIDSGATPTTGEFVFRVDEHSRRTVAWKQVVEDKLGKNFAADVLEHTEPVITRKLAIERRVKI